jgi:hypothetical protein
MLLGFLRYKYTIRNLKSNGYKKMFCTGFSPGYLKEVFLRSNQPWRETAGTIPVGISVHYPHSFSAAVTSSSGAAGIRSLSGS